MRNTRALIMCLQVTRRISSSNVNSSFTRESRFMKRIMHGPRKTRKKWHDTSTDLASTVNIIPTNKSLSVHTVRRMAVRDKLFMEHITDQMSMGEVSNILHGGIEITHVKITPDFKYVNVFWIRNDDDSSSLITKEALEKCGKIIRHELSQLRIIGVVPPIQFVENKQFLLAKEVEKKLAIIDSEKDVESLSDLEQTLSDLQSVASHHGATEQDSYEESASNNDSEMDGPHIQLPSMRHDVLGLDHHKIMSQIVVSLSKSKEAVQRHMLKTNTNAESSYNLASQKVTDFLTQDEQQKIFSDFLTKRRIEEKHRYRMKQSHEQELLNSRTEEEGNEEEEEVEETQYDYEKDYDDEYSDIRD